METVRIGNVEWMVSHFDSVTVSDGTTLPELKTEAEIIHATKNNLPGWTWAGGKPGLGRLYSKEAVFGNSGLIPDGWRVPAAEDFKALEETAGVIPLTEDKTYVIADSSALNGDVKAIDALFNCEYSGYTMQGVFLGAGEGMYLWVKQENDEIVVWVIHDDGSRKIVKMPSFLRVMYALRLVRDID